MFWKNTIRPLTEEELIEAGWGVEKTPNSSEEKDTKMIEKKIDPMIMIVGAISCLQILKWVTNLLP